MRKLLITDMAGVRSAVKKNVSRSREGRLLQRLHCVLLVGQGVSCYQVAEWFSLHPRTVERWVHCVEVDGIAGLLEECKTGRPCKIDDHLLKQLRSDVLQDPGRLGFDTDSWDSKLLQRYLDGGYDVQLSVRQCQRLLRSLKQAVDIR